MYANKYILFLAALLCFVSYMEAQEISASAIASNASDTTYDVRPIDTLGMRIDSVHSDEEIKGIPFSNTLKYDFYSTINFLHLVDAPASNEPSNLSFYYNVTINEKLKIKKFCYTLYFFNEYSYKKYIDSIALKGLDNYALKNSLSWKIAKSKFSLAASANVRSQLWKTYTYKEVDSTGDYEKELYTDYLSPGYKLYSLGVVYRTKKGISTELGLVGGKTTVIRNQEIFETRGKEKLYGLEKGEKTKKEWGVNVVFQAPIIKIRKNLYWENNTIIYCEGKMLKFLREYSLDLNNAFHYVFLKQLRLSIRNQIRYDLEVQDKPYFINQFTLGFYLSNKVK